jgi:hypothetical protein
MRASAGIDVGWMGFGVEGGLLPRVRLGVVSFWWCRGTIGDRIAKLHIALAEATAEIKRNAGREFPDG